MGAINISDDSNVGEISGNVIFDAKSNKGLMAQVESLEAEVARLRERDCNAKVELCYDDGFNPFAREDLKIVDVGVADNV